MTGLLLRLARHSQGTGLPRLRPMARLPFGQPPNLQPASDGEDPSTAPLEPYDRVPGFLQHTVPTDKPDVERPPDTAVRSRPAPTQPAPTAAGFHSPLLPPIKPMARPGTPAPEMQSQLAEPRPTGHKAMSVQSSNATQSAATPEAENTHAREGPNDRHGLKWPEPLFAIDPLADFRPTPNARSETHAPGLRAGNKASSAGVTSEQAPADTTPNEVHVHIERIEVTALQAAPAPTRPRRNATQPLSLQDYLDRKRGKA